MIVKKYVTDTIDKAQGMISEDFGPEAVILTSRHIRYKGIKALFFANKVEVVAAVEEEDLERYQQEKMSLKQVEPILSQKIQEKEQFERLCHDLVKHFKDESEPIPTQQLRVTGPISISQSEPTIVCILGKEKVGKSHVIQLLAQQYREQARCPVIVLEKGEEWPSMIQIPSLVFIEGDCELPQAQRYLVVDATENDSVDDWPDVQGLIFTKMDQVSSAQAKLPVSYFVYADRIEIAT